MKNILTLPNAAKNIIKVKKIFSHHSKIKCRILKPNIVKKRNKIEKRKKFMIKVKDKSIANI